MKYQIKNHLIWISNSKDSGKILFLSDGSSWLINSINQIKTSLWLATDKIHIAVENGDYFLTNSRTNNTVIAEFVG